MRPSQIENWALKIIERVESKQPIEDSRVELKSNWIDPQKGARRLAGHANASRGEPILWLIGVNEDEGVIGVEKEELSTWINKVQSIFESVSPSLQDIAISHNGKTFLALLFETDRAPFVIKVTEYGKMKGLPSHEVPWREGTEIRTARRSDLIKLLVPIIHEPIIELLNGGMTLNKYRDYLVWKLDLQIYITPEMNTSFAIPYHKCQILFEVEGKQQLTNISNLSLKPPYKFIPGGNFSQAPDSNTIIHTKEDVLITGPGRLNIEARLEVDYKENAIIEEFEGTKLKAFVQMLPTYAEKNITLEIPMEWRGDKSKDPDDCIGVWEIAR
jgi:hypothetical protein